MPLTPAEVENIAVSAAKKAAAEVALSREEVQHLVSEAVKQTLIQLGVDASNPIEMQRDFQHLREWRTAGEDLKRKGMLTLLGIFVTGLASLGLLGLREWLAK